MKQQTITNISISESHKRQEVVENHDRPHVLGVLFYKVHSRSFENFSGETPIYLTIQN